MLEGSVRFCTHAQSASTLRFCTAAAPAAKSRTVHHMRFVIAFAKASNVVFMRNIGSAIITLPWRDVINILL
ncbi:hypothetical protein ACNKHM_28685 [Shigella sonnei]